MYEFLDRLVTFALPRVRDFKGVSPKRFDGRGNYSLGIREQIIFPEINYDKIDKIKGMNISIVTTAAPTSRAARSCVPRHAVQELATMAKTVDLAPPTRSRRSGTCSSSQPLPDCAAARARSCASSSCAASASGTSRCAATSPASSSRAGR